MNVLIGMVIGFALAKVPNAFWVKLWTTVSGWFDKPAEKPSK